MTSLDILIKDPSNHQRILDFICSLTSKLEETEYKEELYLLENGYHFNPETLQESGVPIKYGWDQVSKYLDSLKLSFPECVTPEDIVWAVNTMYASYYPLISDLGGALKFAEKYINDKHWPSHDRPYQEWLNRK